MTDYERHHGKVNLAGSRSATQVHDVHGRPLPTDRNALVVAPPASSALTGSLITMGVVAPTTSPLRTYAEWYLAHCSDASPIRTVPTVECFKQESRAAGRKQEAYLWSLLQDIYTDAEQADQYHPDAIGIESMQPHRRWFISQYAHLQAFLQRQPVLRRANIICRWLEATYRDDTRQEPSLHGEEEIVLRQLILTHLRGGELHRAIQAAVTYESCVHSCVLSAAQLQTVQEPWFAQTALVPLFGEYAHGELAQAWCGNEYRLENLSQLYEESLRYRKTAAAAVGAGGSAERQPPNASNDFDAVIGAALCGNLNVLEAAFKVNGNWKDMAWCYLRCALVVAFTKQLVVAAGAGGDEAGRSAIGAVDGSYAAFIEEMTGGGDDWAATFSQKLVQGLAARLQSGFLAHVPLEEQLQMRVILQTLTCMDGKGPSGLFVSGPSAVMMMRPPPPPAAAAAVGGVPAEWFDIVPEDGNSEAARLITHVVLVQDVAYGETLSPHSVQVRAGAALATSLARYAVFLALLPRYPFNEGLRAVTAMTLRLRDPRHRAGVYAAFIKAARDYELERQDLTRSQLEEQEGRLVRQFVTADADSQVHIEVQQLLYQQVAPAEMLTHNKLAEKIMWEAMHADSIADYVRVLRGGLTACCSFWLTRPAAEVEAIADVSNILTRRVLVELQKLSEKYGEDEAAAAAATAPSCSPMTELERSESTFWYVWSEARGIAKRHATTAAELAGARANAAFAGAATGHSNRTLVYQLTQDETTLLNRLVEQTQRALRHGGAVVHRDRQCLTAIIWLVQQLAEEVTLSMLSNRSVNTAEAEEESPAPHDELRRMQQVYELLEELHLAGYFEPELLSQKCASDLYTQIRAMRVSYGQQVHRRQVMAALRARTACRVQDANAQLESENSF
ncbi:hypothetical protein ABB37_04466 [Leptomonas pyrrhocoris]|uniref:Nuclear pore complex protein n=1 Tax=Leptomonas pyrrhocoris TaxID=157538 RepID=A0A0M9G2M9_LEPPY|nr:hypothetical protein ABB37_04466 [Leptomonas pyrrhocoris]KPA81115.1 hypothetical protein ABB37_04466 [Leptomonas pyrrhocoris]|eukprot:XP_015659554.1 hypothetical protein ABB37_04466 [Leptomonas pyrrhocoris]